MANALSVIIGEVRFSYAHLYKPYANPNGDEPKYSVTVLVPKHDTVAKAKIDAAINAAIADGVASKWNGVRPPVLGIPVHDGDQPRPSDGMDYGEECRGHWVFTASTKDKPQVVNAAVVVIPDECQSEVYSGMYGNVSLRFYAYNSNGKKGVGIGLGNVQKTRDGEPLGSRSSAAADFGEFGGNQGFAAPQAAPQYAPQPQVQPQVQPQYAPQPVYGQPQYVAPNAQIPQPAPWEVAPPMAAPQPQYAPPMAAPQGQPVYPGYAPQGQPVYPGYAPQPQQYTPGQPVPQIDPITGQPIRGGIMGL